VVKKKYISVHKSSLIPPLFIEVSVPRKESGRSCICVLGCQLWIGFYDFTNWFWNCSTN